MNDWSLISCLVAIIPQSILQQLANLIWWSLSSNDR